MDFPDLERTYVNSCEPVPKVQCIVRYSSRSGETEKYERTFPCSTLVKELVKDVASQLNFDSATIQLRLQGKSGDKLFTENDEKTLKDGGFSTDLGARNSMILEGIGGEPKRTSFPNERGNGEPDPWKDVKVGRARVSPTVSDEEGGGEDTAGVSEAASIDEWPSNVRRAMNPPPPGLLPPASSPATDYTFPAPIIKQDTGFVGLVNQAMTCYLNSLLQALYMTPEFRNALYKWRFDERHGKLPSKCIPLQLQKLFLNLQTSSKSAVETTDLTKSFGWESGEVWQQHDIQELCREMFDALETEFKETEQSDLINRLYQGKMIDYVKCLECTKEKSREDTFLDIPLPVKPYGSTVAYGSVDEALRAFVQPETLNESNQYFCESCNKKCDAHKGLKFSKFPYLLTLHLKRFDFDYNSRHRIKLNDKVVFPEILNLNHFIQSNDSSDEIAEVTDATIKCDDSSTSDSALDEDTNHISEPRVIDSDPDDDEGIDLSSNCGNNQENEKNRLNSVKGPFVYELYSIMIHSGSASGGHYYAYIKDFARGKWYCFNDQSVTPITREDISKSYGGGPSRTYYSGAYSSSTNAYMLMYRQMDKNQNCLAMTEEEFPPHIKETLELIKEQEEKDRAFRARLEEMIKLKVFTYPSSSTNHISRISVKCHNDDTMDEVLKIVYNEYNIKRVPVEQCRLVTYNKSDNTKGMSFEGREKETILNVLNSMKDNTIVDFFLETREKHQIFIPYNIGDIMITVYLVDVDKCEVESVHHLRTSPCQNLIDLKQFFVKALSLSWSGLHAVLAPERSEPLVYLSNENDPLNRMNFKSKNRVFLAPIGPEGDLTQTFPQSDLFKVLEQIRNIYILYLVFPEDLEDTLESLLIPPLEDKLQESKSSVDANNIPMVNGLDEEPAFALAGGTSDQSTSEDSSLTDSERTIIGDPGDTHIEHLSSGSDSEQISSNDVHQTRNGDPGGYSEENWDDVNDASLANNYFHVVSYEDEEGRRTLRVGFDPYMELSTFKSKIEKYIGVASKYIKLSKEGGDELSELMAYEDGDKLNIHFNRVLNEGERKIKLYLLTLNSKNSSEFLFDWIICNGKTVGETKKLILKALNKRPGLQLTLDRLRLRIKNWKCSGRVILDHVVWKENFLRDISIQFEFPIGQFELFVQILPEPDEYSANTYLLLFTKRWHPSTGAFDPCGEVILDSPSIEILKEKISVMSGIPVENVQVATETSHFPGEIPPPYSNDQIWDADDNFIVDLKARDSGGIVIFYKDSSEETKTFTKEELDSRSNFDSSSNLTSTSSYITNYSPRKEKGLKIYCDNRQRSTIDVD